jgi:CrcB protein
MTNFFAVAIGGAFGALARYGLGIWISGKWTHDFPLHTFLINITGAFLLGLLNTLFLDKLTLSPEMRLALSVGFLGAFTTFSTFGYETIMLMKDGNILTAGIYTLVSIIVGFFGVFLGMGLARFI